MFKNGEYVRLKMAPTTRMGMIEGSKVVLGKVQYHFCLDPRFDDDYVAYIPEDQLERCAKPSDQAVSAINELIKQG